MKKGMDWFKIVSNISHDDDIEYVSDAAFRTFFELIGISAEEGTDGKMGIAHAKRMCNSPHFDDAITELLSEKYLKKTEKNGDKHGDTFTICNYKKHQKTAREIRDMREKTNQRVTRYRNVRNALVTPCVTPLEKSRVEESREEGKEEDKLLTLALAEIPPSESTAEDYRTTIDRYRPKLSDDHIERIVYQLAGWTPTKPRKKLHLTLAQWLNKEPRDPLPPSHAPFVVPDATEMSPEERLASYQAGIGKVMG